MSPPLSSLPTSLILLLLLLSNASAESIDISSTECTFQYSLSSSNFSLTSCTFPQGSYAFWDPCLSRCCPKLSHNDYPIATFNALVICQTKGATSDSSIAVIVMAVAVSFFSLVILLCLIMVAVKIIKGAYLSRVAPEEEQPIEWDCPEELTSNSAEVKWYARKKEEGSQIMDFQCSICLEDGSLAQLICQHRYHPSCIALWLNKSNFCPLCHRDNIRAVKVYCQTCQKRYFLVRNKLLVSSLQTFQMECNVCAKHDVSRSSLDQFQHLPFPQSQNLIFEHDHSEVEIGEMMDR